MELKAAVAAAKRHISEVFSEEKPRDIGLEEIELDDLAHEWRITIGFTRPWDRPGYPIPQAFELPGKRTYKVVRIDDATGNIRSVQNREGQN